MSRTGHGGPAQNIVLALSQVRLVASYRSRGWCSTARRRMPWPWHSMALAHTSYRSRGWCSTAPHAKYLHCRQRSLGSSLGGTYRPIQPGSQRWGQTLPSRHPCNELFGTGATSVAHAIAGMRHGLAPQRAQQGKTGGTLTMLRGTKRPPISGAQEGIPWGPRGRRKASPRQSIGESGRGTARTGRTAPRAARGRADACGM